MITSYEVGAVFRIIDQGSPALRELFTQFERLDKMVVGLQTKFKEFGKLDTKAMTASLSGVETKLKALGDTSSATSKVLQDSLSAAFASVDGKATTAVASIQANFAKADLSIDGTTVAVDRLTAALKGAGQASATVGRVRLGGVGGGSGGGGAHPRPGRGSGSHGVGITSGTSHGGVGIDAGFFGFLGAEAVGETLKGFYEAAAEVKHIQAQMKQAGMAPGDIAKATASARIEGYRYGIPQATALEDIKEIRGPFGSTDEAISLVDSLERMRIVLNAVSPGKGDDAKDAVYKMARTGELKGLVDPKDYLSYFEGMTKTISATGGKVGPNDFMQAAKYSKLSGFGFDEEFFTKYLPTLIQTAGPTTAGTSLMSLFNTLVGGTVTKRSLIQMQDLGLIGDPDKIVYDDKGQPKGFKPGAIKGTDELTRDPLKWAEDVLTPLLEKKYGDLSIAANKETAIQNLSGLFGNRNSASAIAELALRSKSFERDAKLNANAQGLGGVEELQSNDPKAASERFAGAWKNLQAAFGGPATDVVIGAMNGMSAGMIALTKWANDNPNGAKAVVGGMTAIATGLGVLTGAAVMSALGLFSVTGAAAIGIGALVGVLGSLAIFNWDSLSAGMAKLKGWLDQLDHLFGFGGSSAPDIKGQPAFPHTPTPGRGAPSDGSPLFVPMSYSANDNDPAVQIVRKGFVLAFQDISGGQAGGSFGGSAGGLTNASYTTWGSGGGSALSSPSMRALNQASALTGPHADFIRSEAARLGISPALALAVAKSEGFGTFVGDKGTSFGDFQLHYGGSGIPGMNAGGLGDVFTKATGLSAKDPKNWQAMDRFALEYAAKHGWSPWHGAARIGVHGFDGIGHPVSSAAAKVGMPPKHKGQDHIHIHLDGKEITASVTRRQTMASRFPTAVGGTDNHGSYTSPGTPLLDVA